MNSNIEKARSLVESLLLGNVEKMSKEHFFMFTVSKFVALKELIIKKDSDNKKVYFDNIKNAKYISCILKITDYIKATGDWHRNSLKIEYKDETKRTDELDDAIWIFNKIRDSFAHGKYSFDLEKNSIIINNDHMNDMDPYKLVCEIPIELFDFFSFYVKEIDENPNLIDIEEKYQDHVIEINREYNLAINNKFIKLPEIKENIRKNNIKDNYVFSPEKHVIDLEKKSPFSEEKINYGKINNQKKEKLDYKMVIELLKMLLKNDVRITPRKKQKIALALKKYGILLNDDYEYNQENKYIGKCQELLEEIAGILGFNSKTNKLVLPALYNYMQLVLGTSSNIDYSRLRVRNLKFVFDPFNLYPNVQNNYSQRINVIKSDCNAFCNNIEILSRQYMKYPNNDFRRSLIDKFSEFYSKTMHNLGEKNQLIISGIRNSVEHGNFYEDKIGAIYLLDQSNQNDMNSSKFACVSNVGNLFVLTKEIDASYHGDNFTIKDFFLELEPLVGNDCIERLKINFNALSKIIFGKNLNENLSIEQMYQEMIVNILNRKCSK